MLNFLAMVEHGQESIKAIETACSLGTHFFIHPIYIKPSDEHDLSVGAGWVWNTWERENRQKARKDVKILLSDQKQRYPNLKDPVVVSGGPIKAAAGFFLEKKHDLIVTGTPFRGMYPMVLAHRFHEAIHKKDRDLPLWVIKDSCPVSRVVALTDGSDSAEKAIGFLNRFVPHLNASITLIGLARKDDHSLKTEAINLERGFAILREKGINADGFTEKSMNHDGLGAEISKADLLVISFSSVSSVYLFDLFGTNLSSVLFYLNGD